VLDSLGNGIVATQNGAQVVLKNGSLAYDASGQTTSEIVYNTMRTPKGRQFQLVLPDGTKVWLNAASSIKYPAVFTGDTRTVEIDGEAYFEVFKNVNKPFIVKIDEATEVKVLGTHFNINAYDDEPAIKTTLLEGAVKVNKDGASAILQPGEQVSVSQKSQSSHAIPVQTPDLDQVMAWKNGLFNFNGYDIKAVMREIGRWYDLDIVYEAEPEPEEMMGELQRNLTLSQVMKILQKIHVKYRVEGRKLIVMK
jgi:transmembrane sensor